MSQNQRLLYVINHMDWFWSHRLPLAQAAQKAGWVVHVAAAGAARDPQLAAFGFIGHDLPDPRQSLAPLTAMRIIIALYQLYAKLRPDCVHAITIKYVFMAGLAARLRPGLKIVHTIAGLGFLFSGESAKARLLRLCVGPFLTLALNHRNAQVIVQNPDDQNVLIKNGFVQSARCHLILGSGVDLQQFPAKPLPTDEAPLVLMPTRLVRDKGIGVFVQAAHRLKDQGVKARFAIAGGLTRHNPMALTQNEMEDFCADGVVQWLGKVVDMPALYAAAALVVYPSYYGEGIPKVLLEAAASGRAIVTTDHPGCRDVVRDGENGRLVPIKDPQATAQAIAALLADRARLQSLGDASRARAERDFDVHQIAAQTLKVYNF
ncbi:MAG: glycosyltransferase family 4 protein [Alphaproteobacteria bacterium]|nr:glycosyltransferase family 4 protein [Alphaproteobacteria bacterium]